MDSQIFPKTTSSPDSEAENTLTFKRSHLYAALLPLAFVAGLAVGFLFWGRNQASPAAAAAAQPVVVEQKDAPTGAEPTQAQVRRYPVPEDDDYVLGPKEAPITIIEFSDYQCPFCKKWHTDAWPAIQAAFPGQIRFIYRDFPLYSIHAEAEPAAIAANCAGEQGKYYDFHDLLLSGEETLGSATYEKYATQLGLNLDTFKQCLTSDKAKQEVKADYEYAANLGISSTPTFFLNGLPLVGAQPADTFIQVIQKELNGEIPQN